MLPKHLDEKVARLHLEQLGVQAHRAHQGAGRLPRRPVEGPTSPSTTATRSTSTAQPPASGPHRGAAPTFV